MTAKPPRKTDERGRHTSASGKIAASTNVQPSRWCRNADRAKNHGFCSCTRNAVPAVTKASGQVSRHHGDVNRPRTSASSAPPASISTSAQEPWAYMWIAEFVKNAITGQSNTPSEKASVGQRYARQRRIRQTSCPTSASQRRHRPTKRIMAPNAQWIISARGCIRLLEIGEHRPCNEQREQRPDEDDEKRRLEDEPPEPLPAGVQKRDAVRLQDRPDQAGGRGRGTKGRHRVQAECVIADASRGRVMSDRRFHAPSQRLYARGWGWTSRSPSGSIDACQTTPCRRCASLPSAASRTSTAPWCFTSPASSISTTSRSFARRWPAHWRRNQAASWSRCRRSSSSTRQRSASSSRRVRSSARATCCWLRRSSRRGARCR